MSGALAVAALVVGYALAIPFTVWVPGFRRMWSGDAHWAFVAEQTGAALIITGWSLKGNVAAAAVNAAWFLGFGAAYLRKRAGSGP